jgi:HEAT repeat protein
MTRHLSLPIAAVLLLTVLYPVSAQSKFLNRTADDWAGQLKNADAAARRNAAFALGKFGDLAKGYLPALGKLYDEEQDARTREAIVGAIGEIASGGDTTDTSPEPVLIKALENDKDKLVRRSAAWSLGLIGSKNDRVRDALGKALAGDREAVVRQNAAWALAPFDEKAAPMLVAALRDDSSDALVKRDAANALFSVTRAKPSAMRPALDELLAMCKDPSPEVKKAGLAPLGRILERTDAKALPVLKGLLRDGDTEVRRFAALALSNMGGQNAADAVPILLDALRNGEPQLKRSAAVALGNVGEAAAPAVGDLIRALQDPDADLRRNAAVALGGIGKGAAEAVPVLVRTVVDTNSPSHVRVEAGEALTNMGNIPAIKQQLPALLQVLGNPTENGDLRLRLAWFFNSPYEARDRQTMDAAKTTLVKVCGEPSTKENTAVRYQCAFLVGAVYQRQTPDAALNVLAEWLFDNTGKLYSGSKSSVGVSGSEKKGTGDNRAAEVTGDSRTMAVNVLGVLDPERVVAHKDIVRQLRVLANGKDTFKDLKEMSRKLLTKLNQ